MNKWNNYWYNGKKTICKHPVVKIVKGETNNTYNQKLVEIQVWIKIHDWFYLHKYIQMLLILRVLPARKVQKMKITHKNLIMITESIHRYKWKSLLLQVVIFIEVLKNNQIRFIKKNKAEVCNLDNFKKTKVITSIHTSLIINNTTSTIQAR